MTTAISTHSFGPIQAIYPDAGRNVLRLEFGSYVSVNRQNTELMDLIDSMGNAIGAGNVQSSAIMPGQKAVIFSLAGEMDKSALESALAPFEVSEKNRVNTPTA